MTTELPEGLDLSGLHVEHDAPAGKKGNGKNNGAGTTANKVDAIVAAFEANPTKAGLKVAVDALDALRKQGLICWCEIRDSLLPTLPRHPDIVIKGRNRTWQRVLREAGRESAANVDPARKLEGVTLDDFHA